MTHEDILNEVIDQVVSDFEGNVGTSIIYEDLPGNTFFDKMSSLKTIMEVLETCHRLVLDESHNMCPYCFDQKYGLVMFDLKDTG